MIKGFKNFLLRGDVIVIASRPDRRLGIQHADQGLHRLCDRSAHLSCGRAAMPWASACSSGRRATAPHSSTSGHSFPRSSTSSSSWPSSTSLSSFRTRTSRRGVAWSCLVIRRQPRRVPLVCRATSPPAPPSASTAALISRLSPWTVLPGNPRSWPLEQRSEVQEGAFTAPVVSTHVIALSPGLSNHKEDG